MGKRVGIVSAGAWGTAVGVALAEKGHEILMWDFMESVVEDINQRHENSAYLPGVTLPESIRATTELAEAAGDQDFLILATPSLYILGIVRQLIGLPNVQEGKPIIGVLTKGFLETDRGPALIVESLEAYLPGFYRDKLVYISGPSHAEEVARGKLTGLIAASKNGKNSIAFRQLLAGKTFVVFPSLDVVGVQVAAATKNVIAIAFGIMDALAERYSTFGDNAESLILAAGLNEIQTLGKAMGSTHPETFTSIAGVGDLDVTCRSKFGRNRRFGRDIITGRILSGFTDLSDLIAHIDRVGYLPEGAVAADRVKQIIDERGLKLPIMEGVYRVLNQELKPIEAIREIIGGFGESAI